MYTLEELARYPKRIASVRMRLLRHDRRVRKTQEQLDAIALQIESKIAYDSELKNDMQRKTRRLELQAESDYALLAKAIIEAGDRRTKLEIELDLLRNEFSVGKLIARDQIAQGEIAA